MEPTDNRRLRTIFDDNAELYQRARPIYPAELFEDLQRITGIGSGSRVLEVGCGTGQATVPLARLGCEIIAMDIGPRLAAAARRRLSGFPTTKVVVASFEEWPLPHRPFDAVVAATAFHWLDPAVRVEKSAAALRVGGALAILSTHHVSGGTSQFWVEVQNCYERFDPATERGRLLPSPGNVPPGGRDIRESRLFQTPVVHRYEWEHHYRTNEYLDLLLTYSGHRIMGASSRAGLLGCIRRLIDRHYGGGIVKRYLTELLVARRS